MKDAFPTETGQVEQSVLTKMETQCSICRRAAAEFACSSPPLAVCSDCLIQHIETEGAHNSIPTNTTAPMAQVQGNEICDDCREKSAVRFCLCTEPLRKYCEDCDIAHYRKAPLLNHSEHPLSAYAIVVSGRVPLEVFKKKQQFINDFQLRLGLELVNFDAFVNQVREKFDQLLDFVTTKKQALLGDLQVQRTTLGGLLGTAQQEIDGKRYAEAFEVKTYLDDIILNGYQSASPPKIQMFAGAVDLEKVKELVEKAVTYEVGSNLQSEANPLPIPVIKNNSLRLYDPSTLQVSQTTLNQTTRIDRTTAYCYITKDTLLCCGGGYNNVHNEVWKVNVRTSTVVKVASMRSFRCWLGIWNYRDESVYAFGGYRTAPLNTGEKYSLTMETWTNLRSTLKAPKSACSVCEHTGQLFISGFDGSGHSSIEHFSPQSEVFTLLRSDNIKVASIMCSDGESLYCIRQNTIEQVNLTNGPIGATFAVKATFTQVGNGDYWLSCPMKWNRGELVSILDHWQGSPVGLFRFNPAQAQFTQIVAFTY